MANKKTSDYDALATGIIAPTWLYDIADPGTKNYKATQTEVAQNAADTTIANLNTTATDLLDATNELQTNAISAGMLTGGAITDAGGETIDVALGTGYLRTTDSHTGVLKTISWPASLGIAIPTDTVRYIGVEYNSGTPQVIIKSTDLWNKHTEFRLGSVVNESTTLRVLDNPWMVANATGHAIERFFETLPFKRADRIGGLIIGETGARLITVTAGEIYDLTNEFVIAAIDTSVSGGFDTYAGLTQFAAGTAQWDNQNYNNAGTITALAANKWGTLWWYLEADGKLVMNYGIVEHNTQAAADLEGEPPVRPVRVQVHGTLIGRTIFQKSAGTGDFQSAFITQFAGAGSSDHTQLSNLTTGDAGHTQFLMLDGSKPMTGDLNMAGTGGLKVAAGTTGQRPTPVNGHHRYNTTTNLHEFYQNGAWVNYASGPGPGILDKQNIIYVNKAGNDSNSGKNDEQPKLTIGSALTAASAQTPTATNIVTVKVMGGARYAEDITVPSWVLLDTGDAVVVGQVTLGVTMAADSFLEFNKAIPDASSQCIRISGAGTRYIKGNSTAGALNSTFLSADDGATVYLDIVNANAVAAGAKFFALNTGAVLFLKAQTFRETVASTAIGASTVFRNIVDDGANADTTSINTTGDNIIKGKDKVILGNAIGDIFEIEGAFQKWITNPDFIAYNNAQIPNVTGDGTVYTIVLGQTDANIGTHYNPATGIFTAPTTGIYPFKIVLVLTGMSSAFSDVNIRVLRTGTAATWYLHQSDPDKDFVGNYLILNGSIDLKLDSGDTIEFQVQVVGGTKTVNIEQGTTFSGRLRTKV